MLWSTPDAPRAESRGVCSAAGAASSEPVWQPPLETEQTASTPVQRPSAPLGSPAAIPSARSAPQRPSGSKRDATTRKHTASSSAGPSAWETDADRSAVPTTSQQQLLFSARPPPPSHQQPQPPPPLNYYALAPSLQLTQHRHVRRIFAEHLGSAPSSSHPHQPQQQYVGVLVPQLSAAPPPPHQQQSQHSYAFTAADDTSSVVSEASSARSSRTRQVFRHVCGAPSGIPFGSPYGVMPTYTVGLPRGQRNVPQRSGAFAALALQVSPAVPAAGGKRSQHRPSCPSDNSPLSHQGDRSPSARAQTSAKRPVSPQRLPQSPPREQRSTGVTQLPQQQQRQGTANSIASTRQVGHRGSHSASVPSQQQARSRLQPMDAPISAQPSRPTVATSMLPEWSKDSQHLDDITLPREEEEEEEVPPYFSAKATAAPSQRLGAVSLHHSAPPARNLSRGAGDGYAGAAAAREASERLSAAKEAVTLLMTTDEPPSQRRQQPKHEAAGSSCGDDADGLGVATFQRTSLSRPQSPRCRAAADPREIQRTHQPRELVLECTGGLPHSRHVAAGSESRIEQRQQEEQPYTALLGEVVTASAERNLCVRDEGAELILPSSAQPPPTTSQNVTAKGRRESHNSVGRDDVRMSLTQKSRAHCVGESAAARGATEGGAASQDMNSDELGAAEEYSESEGALGTPSMGADDSAEALQEVERAMKRAEMHDTAAVVNSSAVFAPPPRTSVELGLCVDDEPVLASPLATGQRYRYVDPLEEASIDATYMMDALEQQYVRINEETNEEMEDVVNVVELHRRDRASAMPRSFVPKGLYADVLPMLRYPVDEVSAGASASTAIGSRSRSASWLSAGQLTYAPLTEATYADLCAAVWLSRFDTAEAQNLLAMAHGSARDKGTAASDEGGRGGSPSTEEAAYYLDHPSANLLDALDMRLSAYVHAFVVEACAGDDGAHPRSYETACVRLTDRHNIDCLPHSVWVNAAPKTLSLADHVTNVLLAATVPWEAGRRRAVAAKMATTEEIAARRTWPYFLGASPWSYEVVAEKDVHAAMPTPAARLAYAFMYTARMRNLDGGLGSLMFSTLNQQVSEAAFLDCLLMQEKLRLALLHSRANIAACCALRQHALHKRRLSIPLARISSEETPFSSASTVRDEMPSASAPTWTSPALSACLTLHERSTSPPPRRPLGGAPELFRLEGSARVDEEADGSGPPGSAAIYQHEGSGARETGTPNSTEEGDDVVDLYSVAVQLSYFFPNKTQRSMHQLCAALIEDLIAMDALPVPEEVITLEGVILTDRTSIVDALVVEGTQAMRHIITVLSARRVEVQPETVDSYRTSSGCIDTAAVWAAMEKRLISFDPAVMYFLSTPVPVDDLFRYAVTDGPPTMQPQRTGRKGTFVEVLRLQHVAETVQYTMEMQDAILVAGQFSHLVAATQQQRALANRRDRSQQRGCHSTQSVAEEMLMDTVAGQSVSSIGHPDSSASLLAVLDAGNSEEAAAGVSLEGLLLVDASRGGGHDVSVRAVLIALCCADPEKSVAEVQAYVRHLLVLYFELRTPDGSPVDSSDPQQVAAARLVALDVAMRDWFGETTWNGTLRAGAAPALCDSVRIKAEELASLCPRVLGRRVGTASTAVADAAAAVIAASTVSGSQVGPGGCRTA
ncbi:hypothetical protein LSCM1_07481 [Leishmania martiniquensis]|uniref:Uncharacterized protein n=1 Tax=Leishmania martiniquensis TaxID=1580590 RepID=A0A836H9X0_9TRYP|nr:hypothetical protein LSCM1_07481 [Leishmania martiniquensis]